MNGQDTLQHITNENWWTKQRQFEDKFADYDTVVISTVR